MNKISEEEIRKNFSNRFYEICILKNISRESVIEKLKKDFSEIDIINIIEGKQFPDGLFLVAISKIFDKSVDYFFESGERLSDKNEIIKRSQNNKIKHLEELLKTKINYTAENFNDVLKKYVFKALDKELMSSSFAAYYLDISLSELDGYKNEK